MSELQWGQESYTPKQVAQWLNIVTVTVHQWAKDYSEYLSEGAVIPDEKLGRQYNHDDCEVLYTVARLRDKDVPHKLIYEQLAQGFRVMPNTAPDESDGRLIDLDASGLTELDVLRAQLSEARQQLVEMDALKAENERLKGQVEALERVIGMLSQKG